MSREDNRARGREARRRFGRSPIRSPLVAVARAAWPRAWPDGLLAVWSSPALLVQAYVAPLGCVRLTVNRHDARDGISWDDLCWVLHTVYPGRWAVEVYPPAGAVVDVAPMRHLWAYPLGVTPAFDLRRMEP